MCHVGFARDRARALDAGDTITAAGFATRIAGTPANNLDDLAAQIDLLIELEDPASMPPGMLLAMLLLSVQRGARRFASEKITKST
jgi:hypothetical protein